METPRAHTTPSGPSPIAGRRGERRWARSPGESWYRPAPMASDRPLLPASRLVGARVFNATGRRIGRIAELALDEASGAVAFVTLAYGGFLGLGERVFRASWAQLAYVPRRGGFVLVAYEPSSLPEARTEVANAP